MQRIISHHFSALYIKEIVHLYSLSTLSTSAADPASLTARYANPSIDSIGPCTVCSPFAYPIMDDTPYSHNQKWLLINQNRSAHTGKYLHRWISIIDWNYLHVRSWGRKWWSIGTCHRLEPRFSFISTERGRYSILGWVPRLPPAHKPGWFENTHKGTQSNEEKKELNLKPSENIIGRVNLVSIN